MCVPHPHSHHSLTQQRWRDVDYLHYHGVRKDEREKNTPGWKEIHTCSEKGCFFHHNHGITHRYNAWSPKKHPIKFAKDLIRPLKDLRIEVFDRFNETLVAERYKAIEKYLNQLVKHEQVCAGGCVDCVCWFGLDEGCLAHSLSQHRETDPPHTHNAPVHTHTTPTTNRPSSSRACASTSIWMTSTRPMRRWWRPRPRKQRRRRPWRW